MRDLNDTFMDIAQKTKRLARKQMGWFGRDPRIHWLQALNPKLVDNAMAIIAHADAGDYDPDRRPSRRIHPASSGRYHGVGISQRPMQSPAISVQAPDSSGDQEHTRRIRRA